MEQPFDDEWFVPTAPDRARQRVRNVVGALSVMLIVLGTVALLALAIGLYGLGPNAQAQACARACERVGMVMGAPRADGRCRCAPPEG